LIIHCPYCGERSLEEFRSGGELRAPRPTDPEAASDADWADYLFYRDNIKGHRLELWAHHYGCRQWFALARNTVSHEVSGSWRLEELPESLPADLKAVE
jgi:heterotetrameric sarcosine oxidase delta subunit